MQPAELLSQLEDSPIIAAVKSDEGLESCLACGCRVVYILYGDILNIPGIISRIKDAGKAAIVHIDLIEGLAAKEIAVDFIAQTTLADGIISTKAPLIRRAKADGLIAIQRFFLLDSLALQNVERQIAEPDMVDILPGGVMPKIIRQLTATIGKPLIAGGLLRNKEDVTDALGAGATAVSTTNESVWQL